MQKKSVLVKTESLAINDHQFTVEIADTNTKRAKGLSNRQKLAQNEGMLFIFPEADFHTFWMKGMNFPLDFIWINSNKIIDLSENIPNPEEDQHDLPVYRPKHPVDKVLEVNAGIIRKLNIRVGDIIEIN
jgi:uncharacterized membrane protein (UPF0127 family)